MGRTPGQEIETIPPSLDEQRITDILQQINSTGVFPGQMVPDFASGPQTAYNKVVRLAFIQHLKREVDSNFEVARLIAPEFRNDGKINERLVKRFKLLKTQLNRSKRVDYEDLMKRRKRGSVVKSRTCTVSI